MSTPENMSTWPQLMFSMVFGEVEEGSFTGVLRLLDHDDRMVRVFKRPGEYRVETLDGVPLAIRSRTGTYEFTPAASAPAWHDDTHGRHFDDFAHVLERRELRDWEGDDFTRPTGPAEAVEHLGRPAWRVELAPPAHKPSPLLLTIDAATGMDLRSESRDFGVLHEWVELTFAADLDDSLFAWDGEIISYRELIDAAHPEHAEHRRRARKARAKDKKWLRRSGLRELTIRIDLPIRVHNVDRKTGEIHAGVESPDFLVSRRRATADVWEADGYPHEKTWTANGWDWRLQSTHRISKRTVKHLRRQTRNL